jgi:hypothetical protein
MQSTLASVPSDLVLDRLWVHGLSGTNLIRCVALNSARTSVTDSYITDCHAKGYDSQAIWGGNGPGPYKIVNNMLQGAGENVMFGGTDPSIPGVVPSDIEFRRNYVYTPTSWKGTWTRKNLFEVKNGVRIQIDGNVFDGSWVDGQTGGALAFKSANQGGGCSWCRATDIVVSRNLIRNVSAGISIAPNGDKGPTDTTARRIHVLENILEIGAQPNEYRGFVFLNGIGAVTIEKNVLANAGTLNNAAMVEGGNPLVVRDNVWARGSYGVGGTGKNAIDALNYYAPGWSWTNNTMVGATQSGYPTGTLWVSTESAAPLASQIRSVVNSATAGVPIP